MLGSLVLLAAVSLNETDRLVYDSIYAPKVTGVAPAFALRYLTWTESGAIRCYGDEMIAGKVRRVYTESTNLGLDWKTHIADAKDPGAMVKSHLSGDWFTLWEDSWGKGYKVIRSKQGPGDLNADKKPINLWGFNFFRQPQYLPINRKWAITAGCSSQLPSLLFSTDDGFTWRRVSLTNGVSTAGKLIGFDKGYRWDNHVCEPTLLERRDGSLWLMCRTSFDHPYLYKSFDGGESWQGPEEASDFWMSNTMPTFFRLKDGRILFFWNNNQPLPKRDPKEYPELHKAEIDGMAETVFSNRDILHVAISEDDGETWKGFRELILNPIRNREDFREQGNLPPVENDKSVHQEQALELPGGKVLLHLGQNPVSRRFVIFDPNWVLEKERTENFRYGTDGISNYLFLRSLSGGQRGWAGHCAWNRIPGAVIMREPDTVKKTKREALNLARIPDPRLVTDRQGVAWNFPAAREGKVELDCYMDGKEFYIALSDHFITPSDEQNFAISPVVFKVEPNAEIAKKWITVSVSWSPTNAVMAVEKVEGVEKVAKIKQSNNLKSNNFSTLNLQPSTSNLQPEFGYSYLHLRSTAEKEDFRGTYFREFRKRDK